MKDTLGTWRKQHATSILYFHLPEIHDCITEKRLLHLLKKTRSIAISIRSIFS